MRHIRNFFIMHVFFFRKFERFVNLEYFLSLYFEGESYALIAEFQDAVLSQ